MTDDQIKAAAQRGISAGAVFEIERARITGSCRAIHDVGGMTAVDCILDAVRQDLHEHRTQGGGA